MRFLYQDSHWPYLWIGVCDTCRVCIRAKDKETVLAFIAQQRCTHLSETTAA